MQHAHLRFDGEFRVAFGNEHGQAAEMTIGPGGSEGGPDNRHRGADQWLFVVSGTGEAIVKDQRIPLHQGTLLLIQRGETHQIRNNGREPLKTLNIYVPPAYTADGEELSAGRS